MKIRNSKFETRKGCFRISHLDFRASSEGLLLIEILLAVAIFGMVTLIVLSAFVYSRQSTAVAGDTARASQVANGAVEALHNIAQNSFSNLANYSNGTTYYLNINGTQWALGTTPTLINNLYTPSIVFSDGPSGSRQAKVTVKWQATTQRQSQVSATTYLSDWQASSGGGSGNHSIKTGLLVYANGGTTTGLIDYRQLQSDGQWTSPLPLPGVGTSKVARSVKLYSAQTGKAKVLIARFYDGNYQYIYGFPWSGSTWGTPQQLTQWRSSDGLDSGNFSGTYLANGTFISIYSDNSNAPKFNTYNGATWSSQGSLGAISGYSWDSPTSMIIHARPGTNEAMMALLGENYQTLTKYYNGSSWSGYTTQATNGTSDGTHNVDFDWSGASGAVYGGLVYTTGSNDRSPTVRIFTADGKGGGSWGNPMVSLDQPRGSIVLSVAIAGQVSGNPNFIACDKDDANTQHIYCYTASPGSIGRPSNYVLSPTTASGGQQTMELGFEDQDGTTGLAGYADGSTSAQLKTFNSTSNSWDASPLSAPTAAANIDKTRLIPEPGLNDAMLLQIDSQNNLYSIMFNGNSKAFYTTPSGYAWTIHNANGPSVGAKWFDFGWDN